jgi:hypothetical protein
MTEESTLHRVVLRFCGLAPSAVLLLSTKLVCAEPFTLVVMPDTQTESTNTPQVKFPAMAQWIADNRAPLNIRFVAHVGDLVNWETPQSTPPNIQYVNADAAMHTLDVAGIPYAIAIGNHDTAAVGGVNPDGTPCHCGGSAAPGDVHANLRNTQTFNQFFPLSRFVDCKGQYEPPKVDNTFHTFSAGGVDWLLITAELDPRPGALAWFNDVVSRHPDHNVIYLTHNYLAPSGNLAGPVGYGDLSPQAVWDGLIKLHGNIRFVLSGHLTETALRQTAGADGKTVYQLLTDYQNLGDAWLRTLLIDPQAKTVKSEVYSPYLKQYKTGPTEEFTLTDVELIPPKPAPDAGHTDAGGNAGGSAGADASGSNGGATASGGGNGVAGSGGASVGGSSGGTGVVNAGGAAARSGGGTSGSAQGGTPAIGGDASDASTARPSGAAAEADSNCGCRLAGTRPSWSGWELAALVAAAFRRRKHRGDAKCTLGAMRAEPPRTGSGRRGS